ncbi:MAG TPA: DUF433 domain-containing protein [bacterium]|jgi:uncharacterized protein (DUF433 family)
MSRDLWKERVVIDPEIHHGDPCIKGTRIPISIIVGSLADGQSVKEVITAYPRLTQDDVRAALQYAAEILRYDVILPVAD